jgi:hypothetical protein
MNEKIRLAKMPAETLEQECEVIRINAMTCNQDQTSIKAVVSAAEVRIIRKNQIAI